MWKHVPLKETGLALAFLLLLSAAYVGGYCALVTRKEVMSSIRLLPPSNRWSTHNFTFSTEMVAEYRIGGEVSKSIFSVCHDLDRRFRPKYWSPGSTP